MVLEQTPLTQGSYLFSILKGLAMKFEAFPEDVLHSGSGLGGKHLANCRGNDMKKSLYSFLSLNIYQNVLYQNKYLVRNTVRLQQHGPKLCPCWPRTRTWSPAGHFVPREDKKKLPGLHGLPSTLIKEQRENVVPIKILGIFTQTFTWQLSITPPKNSLQCVTRNILLCLNFFLPKLEWKGEGN